MNANSGGDDPADQTSAAPGDTKRSEPRLRQKSLPLGDVDISEPMINAPSRQLGTGDDDCFLALSRADPSEGNRVSTDPVRQLGPDHEIPPTARDNVTALQQVSGHSDLNVMGGAYSQRQCGSQIPLKCHMMQHAFADYFDAAQK